MNNFEFISYKQYPDDSYTNAVAKVRIDRKHVVTFAQKKMKDGGFFWSTPSINVMEGGEKRYFPSYSLDSRVEEEMLIEFIKENVKRLTSPVQTSASIQYPHGMGQRNAPPMPNIPPMPPTSMSELVQEEIPF